MEECVYWTKRKTDTNDQVTCFVLREKCTKCKKAFMGKPVEKGKVKIRASEYVCPSCNYTISKEEYEPTLKANIIYTCSCGHKGEISIPFKRKKYMGVDALIFECAKCSKKIAITKKMKGLKDKKSKEDVGDEV